MKSFVFPSAILVLMFLASCKNLGLEEKRVNRQEGERFLENEEACVTGNTQACISVGHSYLNGKDGVESG